MAHKDEIEILTRISVLGEAAIRRERSRERAFPRETGLSKLIRTAFDLITKMRENRVRWRVVASVILESGAQVRGIEAISDETIANAYNREKKRRERAANLTAGPHPAQNVGEVPKVDGVGRKRGDHESVSAPVEREPQRETGDGLLSAPPKGAPGAVVPVEAGGKRPPRKSTSIESVMYGAPRRGDVVDRQEVDPEEERLAILRVKWTWMHERLYYGGNVKQGDVLRGPPPEWDGVSSPSGIGKFPEPKT